MHLYANNHDTVKINVNDMNFRLCQFYLRHEMSSSYQTLKKIGNAWPSCPVMVANVKDSPTPQAVGGGGALPYLKVVDNFHLIKPLYVASCNPGWSLARSHWPLFSAYEI